MKTKTIKIHFILLIFFILTNVNAQSVGTKFTYQGELLVNGSPANGLYDFKIDAFEFNVAGSSLLLLGPEEYTNVTVAGGVFTINYIDFGNLIFASGSDTWLELSVKVAGGSNYTQMSPREKITSSPYAIKADFSNTATNADNATVATKANDLNISGASGGDVLAFNGVNWASANSLHVHGNSGTSIGTTNVPPSDGLLVQGDTKIRGDVYQDLSKAGLPKYMVNVNCGDGVNSITGQDLTGNNGSFSISSNGLFTGYCFIEFPTSIAGKFWVVNAESNDAAHVSCNIDTGDSTILQCQRVNKNGVNQFGKYQIIVF